MLRLENITFFENVKIKPRRHINLLEQSSMNPSRDIVLRKVKDQGSKLTIYVIICRIVV